MRGSGINAVLVPRRVVQCIEPFHPARPYLPRRYAINELHERIPRAPKIRREVATGCVQEMSLVRGAGMKACSISPRQIIGPALSLANGVSRDNDSPMVEKIESEDIVEEN